MLEQKLIQTGTLEREEWIDLLENYNENTIKQLREEAVRIRKQYYGNNVYIRGLIEYTNYCKNNCYYCGIRAENKTIRRYRLDKEEILDCCYKGYELGFRTFVLQGGEDSYDTKERMVHIVKEIRMSYPDCAITLSIGERTYEEYKAWKEAGANRYLLRHETANELHYQTLHPHNMKLSYRKQCLYQLKELGYQVGAGFMVGSPFQTNECLAEDLLFLKELQPQMVGIGPFLPHACTPFRGKPKGSVEKTLLLLSIIRILIPNVLLPATTALGTSDNLGREKGICAGANVVMPNLSPLSFRKQYELYNNKVYTGEEAAESIEQLEESMNKIGYQISFERGDPSKKRKTTI